MLGLLLNSFNDSTISEPEQDANSALTELETGLRSGRVGEQCEAIVRFPRLFEKYPFPILINSSFLKLADVFRLGNNFLRLWVLRVCQQSSRHLDKIMNYDEVVRRIFSVIHSNDPVARALVLRTFGALAAIIPEKQNVHHAIRRGLDSHDSVEVEAAIHAASQFAAQSKVFAVSMCNKISEMIRGQATPAGMKLRLLPALRHMHHDAAAAGPVRALLSQLLPRLPAAPFTRLMLRTLTHLAAATLIDVPDQVELLLGRLGAARAAVRTAAAAGLRRLAGSGRSGLWPPSAAGTLATRALALEDPTALAQCLGVLRVLMREPLLVQANAGPDCAVRELCRRSLYNEDLRIASEAAHILTVMAVYCCNENLPVRDVEELAVSLEALIIITGQSENVDADLPQLKLTLGCVVKLCARCPAECPRLVRLLGGQLQRAQGHRAIELAAALGAIGTHHPEYTRGVLPAVLRRLALCTREADPEPAELDTLVLLCTVVFQAVAGHAWPPGALAAVRAALQPADLWVHFRVARAALRYGQHPVGAEVLEGVAGRAGSESTQQWLGALLLVSRAEAALQGATPRELPRRLRRAQALYHQALAALKASPPQAPAHVAHAAFLADLVRLRAELLGACARLLAASRAFCAQPPPAIAHTQAQTSRDELLRCGHITQQLRRAGQEMRGLAEGYCRLYQASFDADPATLQHLQILQQMCSLLAQSLERVSAAGPQDRAIPDFVRSQDLSDCPLEARLLIETCRKIDDISVKTMENRELKAMITHRQAEGLWRQAAAVCRGPLPLPRFLFQPLQATSVRLAVSPQPRQPADHHSVPYNHHLALKVEGVIRSGPRGGLFRRAAAVHLTLTAHAQRTPDAKGEPAPPFLVLTERVRPAHDFFSAQLLVNLSGAGGGGTGGSVLLALEAALLDEEGALWRTGPRHTLNIKILEDPTAKNAQSQAARRF